VLAEKGAHELIVPQSSAEKRVALSRGEVKAPAKSIVEIGCVMHTATGYKHSGAIARYGALRWRGISRERIGIGHVRDAFLHPSGGESVATIWPVLLIGMSDKTSTDEGELLFLP
jgi:hypothetical protein